MLKRIPSFAYAAASPSVACFRVFSLEQPFSAESVVYRIKCAFASTVPYGGRPRSLGADAAYCNKMATNAIAHPMRHNILDAQIERFDVSLPKTIKVFRRYAMRSLT